eukprot:s1156_g40.t1
MESLHASCAAELQPFKSGDVKMPAEIEKPSPTTKEGADDVKDKTGTEQQANLESPKEGGKATDDLWQVKTEIKEELEDDVHVRSGQDVRVKDENAEEQHESLASCGYEVATEEMVPEQSAKAAKNRDVQKTLRTYGLSSAKQELADGVKVKTERCAEPQVNIESPQKARMEKDNLCPFVKTEIKEEIEDDMTSLSFDCDPPGQDAQVKDENAEEQHESLASCGYEVATEEMVPDQSVKAAKNQTAAEPESKPAAKRRRLTRRDVQKTLRTDRLSSAKQELADGVKVKAERCAEQQVNLESPQKGKMEMDDLWLRVREEIRKQSGLMFAASSQAAGNAMQPSEDDSGASEAHASYQKQEPSETCTEDTAKVIGHEERCWEKRLRG